MNYFSCLFFTLVTIIIHSHTISWFLFLSFLLYYCPVVQVSTCPFPWCSCTMARSVRAILVWIPTEVNLISGALMQGMNYYKEIKHNTEQTLTRYVWTLYLEIELKLYIDLKLCIFKSRNQWLAYLLVLSVCCLLVCNCIVP